MNKLLELLFPGKCPFCRKLSSNGAICPKCRKELPFVKGADRCVSGRGYGRCAVALYYEGVAREGILRYKFGGRRGSAAAFGELIAQCAAENFSGQFDTVTWVPVSRKRLRKRGYDQAQLIAQAAARLWETEALPLLKKVRDVPTQSKKDAAARRANVLGAFAAQNEDKIAGRRILLIDDVRTTGATLGECAGVLRRAGAADVMCAVLATPRMERK
ncbi:MAG: ComF family protein [Oscillospiraceae bacterium]|nr:ComF family protein [Oscillospiraceae bacterium]